MVNEQQAILRRPLKNFDFYKKHLEGYNYEIAERLFSQHAIQNAIGLASTDLYEALRQMFENKKTNQAALLSFYKYLLRLTTRCTPFGLFSACGVVRFSHEVTDQNFSFYSKSTIDYTVLENITNNLKKQPHFLKSLSYKVNPTVYQFNGYLRYTQAVFDEKGNKNYSLFAIKATPLLKALKKKNKGFVSFSNLLNLVASADEEKDMGIQFLLSLIHNQFLVSNFELSITSSDELLRLAKLMHVESQDFIDFQKRIVDFDRQSLKTFFDLKTLKRHALTHNIKIKKSIIQTDLFFEKTNFSWSNKQSKQINQTLNFLKKVNSYSSTNKSAYTVFKDHFIKRYEHQTIPLLEALDVETGIGFGSKYTGRDSLISQFSFPEPKETNNSLEWSSLLTVLNNKRKIALQNGSKTINLSLSDFNIEDKDYTYFPTYTAMIEEFIENNEGKISLLSVVQGGCNKLIGRFTFGNSDICHLAKDLHQVEKDLLDNFLLAEIIHQPQNNVGNVVKREKINPIEIQFLGYSENEEKNIIPLDDLFVTIKNNRVVLWSKKHQKIVLPMMSNAHNYIRNEMPIYEFLCGLENHYFDSIYNISWGFLTDLYDYFPRVSFGDVLLIKEKWVINKTLFNAFIKTENKTLNDFIELKNIKKIIQWVNGDQTLLIDLNHDFGKKIFTEIVNSADNTIFEEFIFIENLSKEEDYANQLLLFGNT